MERHIEWIKEGIALCTSIAEISEEDKIRKFSQLERQYKEFEEEEKKKIKNILNTKFETNDIIYVFSCFIKYMQEEDFQEEVLDNILKGDFDCYIGSMLELQAITKIKNFYQKKRMLHKKNVEKFYDFLDRDYSYIPVENRDKKRIVIITEQILSILHAPTKVVLNYAYVLQKFLGYEVLLIALPSDLGLPDDLWYQPLYMNSIEKFRNVEIQLEYQDVIFRGYQVNMSPVNPKEYTMLLDLIYAWNPIFVFNMGVFNPIADIVGKFTTVASMGMTTECPVSEAKIFVRYGKTDETLEEEYLQVMQKNQIQLFIEEKMPVIVKKSTNNYVRAEEGLPEEKFLIAVVGNRLDMEIDEEFVQVMRRMLDRVHNIAFVIIGNADRVKTYFDKSIFDDKIYYLGYRQDLVGTYSMLDLYVNPKRTGGGFSSTMALIAGLPVVTLPDCDVAFNVGEEFIVQTYDEMVDIVCKYVLDQKFYAKKKKCAENGLAEDQSERLIEHVQKVISEIITVIEKKG